MVKHTGLARRLLVVAASAAWIMLFMGDFCEDILGVPLFLNTDQRMDLTVDAADLALTARPQADTVTVMAGDYDIPGDIEMPEDLGDIEIPSDWELPENLSEYELPDIDMSFIQDQLPECAVTTPSQTNPGEDCLCYKGSQVFFKHGCLLGSARMNMASSKEISKLEKYINGIYLRKLNYIVQAKQLGIELPSLTISTRRLIQDSEGQYTPSGDWVVIGQSEAVSAGYLNTWFFDARDGDWRGDGPVNDETGEAIDYHAQIENAVADCDTTHDRYCEDCQTETSQCAQTCAAASEKQFMCADLHRVQINLTSIEDVSDILQSLMFEVQVTFGQDVEVTSQLVSLMSNPQIRLQMRLLMDLVIIVVPPT